MCWGLRPRAQLVVLVDTQYYDGAEHRYADYPITSILQASQSNTIQSGWNCSSIELRIIVV